MAFIAKATHYGVIGSNYVHPSARRGALPLAVAERLNGQAHRESGLIPEVLKAFLDGRPVLLWRSFVSG